MYNQLPRAYDADTKEEALERAKNRFVLAARLNESRGMLSRVEFLNEAFVGRYTTRMVKEAFPDHAQAGWLRTRIMHRGMPWFTESLKEEHVQYIIDNFEVDSERESRLAKLLGDT